MSSAPCYNGPNPVKDDERPVIWKWAKMNGIDQGLPYEKVSDAINTHFFAGQGKQEWIDDILGGRKTPFREIANDMWRKAYNRRVITQQAKDMIKQQSIGPLARTFQKIWNIPRAITVGQLGKLDLAHGGVFPVTHAGDLIMRPASWGTFFKGAFNVWSKMWSPAATERLLNTMKRDPLFETALRSGLDVGEHSHPSGIISTTYHGPSMRAWDMLTTMRYELWNKQMQKYIKPGMSQTEILDIGKNLAEWANHATGSAKTHLPEAASQFLFGPKLTASKLARMVADPIKTLKTFSDWGNATAGEKAVAWTRLSGLTQYAASGLGFLAANQGLLMALNQKQQINFTDPTKSDWLAFKLGGLEWSIPGMHSEIRTLGQILATSFATSKQLHGDSRYAHLGQILGQYAESKLNPIVGRTIETAYGQNFLGRPVPWSSSPGTPKKPRMSWGEYASSIGPIPLEGPLRYFYDQMRQNGTSALDTATIMKGLIIYGMGATGLHVSSDYSQQNATPMRTRHHRTQVSK